MLEDEPANNNVIFEIIGSSVAERVLSKYSAFLCLEDTSQICKDCVDETQFTSTTDPGSADSLLTAYPNPFIDQVVFVLKGDLNNAKTDATLEIYSIDGRLIRHFEQKPQGAEVSFTWNGADEGEKEVAAGLYVAIARTGGKSGVLKVVKR